MNLATARYTRRGKEAGMRKVAHLEHIDKKSGRLSEA